MLIVLLLLSLIFVFIAYGYQIISNVRANRRMEKNYLKEKQEKKEPSVFDL